MYGTFSYSENDLARITGIFGGSRDFLATPSITACRRKYEAISKKQVELQLHGLTLTEYLHVQRIPRGLRVNLQPTLFSRNDEFKTNFAGIINKCSRDLMALNIEFIKRELKDIEVELVTLQSTMTSAMPPDELAQFNRKLTETLDRFKNDVVIRKKQKFDRDTMDYEHGAVYNWTQTTRGRDRSRSAPFYSRESSQQHGDQSGNKESFSSPFLSTGADKQDEGGNENRRDNRPYKEQKQQPRREARNK
ncbi:hypothetical protein XELAEV_18025167mg [Xenopus laevis]|uniref:Uncharacterized protein n=1 Tax=Xenopus laevis TaxID=8355 RepID=A0A974HLM1_XENLA|nr:hypothetical protein XELAEV_18025167mg [Xenopus laevis]